MERELCMSENAKHDVIRKLKHIFATGPFLHNCQCLSHTQHYVALELKICVCPYFSFEGLKMFWCRFIQYFFFLWAATYNFFYSMKCNEFLQGWFASQ